MPKTIENTIAVFRFLKAILDRARSIDIELYEDIKKRLGEMIENVLRLTSPYSFNEVMDFLLRSLGRDLVKELISPNLISELWGLSALRKFNETIG